MNSSLNHSEYLIKVGEDWVLIPDLIEKKKAHIEGILHPTEHVWIYNTSGWILLQKRPHIPGKSNSWKFDVSVAWHTSTTLSIEELASMLPDYSSSWEIRRQSAIREINEELVDSLTIQEEKLCCIWIYRVNNLWTWNNEHVLQYILESSDNFQMLDFDRVEVGGLYEASIFALESDLLLRENYVFDLVTRDPHYYAPIFRAIRSRLWLQPNKEFEDFVLRTPKITPDFTPVVLSTSSTNSSETNS